MVSEVWNWRISVIGLYEFAVVSTFSDINVYVNANVRSIVVSMLVCHMTNH